MLDLRFLVENPNQVEATLKKRNMLHLVSLLNEVASIDKSRRAKLQEVESKKQLRNESSNQIAQLKKSGQDTSEIMAKMKGVGEEIKNLDSEIATIQEKLSLLMYEFPNLLNDSVPEGKSSEENKLIKSWGDKRSYSFALKSHDQIGEKLGILDFKKGGEVAGARFVFLKGLAARLERALINFMLDLHREAGYEEMVPPFLVNRSSLTGTGQLPKFQEDVFHIEKFDFFLIPTAEVPVTNYHCQEILEEKALPKWYTAYTPCFRSEAGSYGKDTKGLKRQHQFDKVELVKFVHPESSDEELEQLLQNAEMVLQKLQLPYRVMALCGGDIGFGSGKTYDIEVWSPFINGYMEISSCSNFYDYQARRANIRYRDTKTGKVQFVHTLNGSGLAVGRTLLAIMENYQKEDGTFDIPEALQKYL